MILSFERKCSIYIVCNQKLPNYTTKFPKARFAIAPQDHGITNNAIVILEHWRRMK